MTAQREAFDNGIGGDGANASVSHPPERRVSVRSVPEERPVMRALGLHDLATTLLVVARLVSDGSPSRPEAE